MLLMAEKRIRRGIYHSINKYAKTGNKYTKNYKNKESSYLKYWDINYLYDLTKKLPVNDFEWVEDTSPFNEESDEGYFFEADVQYSKKLHDFHNDLPILTERMKIEKVEKLVANLHSKTEHVFHVGNLKQP